MPPPPISAPTAVEGKKRKPFARILRWSRDVEKQRGTSSGEGSETATLAPEGHDEHRDQQWEYQQTSSDGDEEQQRRKDDGALHLRFSPSSSPADLALIDGLAGSVAASPRPVRPPLPRAQTWAHRIRPSRPPAPPARATEPTVPSLPLLPPPSTSAAGPSIQHRRNIPALAVKSPLPTFTTMHRPPHHSRSRSEQPPSFSPSQPDSPASPRSKPSSPYTPFYSSSAWQDRTPSADESLGGASNPFFRPSAFGGAESSSPSSRFGHTSRFSSQQSSTPTTARYSAEMTPRGRLGLGGSGGSPVVEPKPSPPISRRGGYEESPYHPYAVGLGLGGGSIEEEYSAASSETSGPRTVGAAGPPPAPTPSALGLEHYSFGLPTLPPPAYDSFLETAFPDSAASAAASTESLSDAAALSFSRRPSADSATSAVEAAAATFAGEVAASFIRVVHDADSDDELVSLAEEDFPSREGGLVSRFSDWTPTPPDSASVLSLLEPTLEVAGAKSFLDVSSGGSCGAPSLPFPSLAVAAADEEGWTRPRPFVAVDVLAATLAAPLEPRKVVLLDPAPSALGRSKLAEKRAQARATFPPAGLRVGLTKLGVGGFEGAKGGKENGARARVVAVQKTRDERRASTGRGVLLGVAG
ncbi:hypothetical protein JCM8097_003600 [Rhodosporidiobolus ruineniae]